MLIALFLSLWPVQLPHDPAPGSPPGMLLVPGGATRIGSRIDEIEKLALEREELAFSLAGETPQHVLEVEDFYLMPSEVTNEQYLEFVRATDARPPRSWGAEAIQAGQVAFLEEQGRSKQAARAAGKPFEPKVFEAQAWWADNWRAVDWRVPAAELQSPVVFVNYAEAQAYARWAGFRLMTEFEYVRAGRGDTTRTYPWGDQWEDKRFCRSLHSAQDLPAPVGQHPEGATGGIHDLCGNVWEWTSSPFTPFPGYQALRFTTKKRVIESLAPFDAELRVTVGGSFQMDRIGVRLSTRRDADRSQSTNALGFRCAASTEPALDAARWVLEHGLDSPLAKDFDPHQAAIMRRWSTLAAAAPVPGYAVVAGYEHVLACPVQGLDAASARDLAEASRKGALFIGLVEVARPLLQPELAAGTYLLAWRASGKVVDVKEASLAEGELSEASLQELPGFEASHDCVLWCRLDGKPVAALAAAPVRVERLHATDLALEASPTSGRTDTLQLTLNVASLRSRSKGLVFDLALRFAGTFESDWK